MAIEKPQPMAGRICPRRDVYWAVVGDGLPCHESVVRIISRTGGCQMNKGTELNNTVWLSRFPGTTAELGIGGCCARSVPSEQEHAECNSQLAPIHKRARVSS